MAFAFSFDFNIGQTQTSGTFGAPVVKVRPAQLLSFTTDISKPSGALTSVEEIKIGGSTLLKYKIVTQQRKELPLDADDVSIITSYSDLKPGIYEGGFKLWECAIDLGDYLFREAKIFEEGNLVGKRVLELGCGHGLPGMLCLLHGAFVDFQDYNHEVLSQLTMPNVLLNFSPSGTEMSRARFIAGDWGEVAELLETISHTTPLYDYILSADTLYNPDSYPKLLGIIKRYLRADGTAVIAAKTFYFGIGGSTLQFIETAKKLAPNLRCVSVKRLEDGVSNVREILKLTYDTASHGQ